VNPGTPEHNRTITLDSIVRLFGPRRVAPGNAYDGLTKEGRASSRHAGVIQW